MNSPLLDTTFRILEKVCLYLENDEDPEDYMQLTINGKSAWETWGLEPFKLQKEVNQVFKNLGESKLQDRYANYIISHLKNHVIPIRYLSKIELDKYSQLSFGLDLPILYDDLDDEHKKYRHWSSSFATLHEQTDLILSLLSESLNVFAPENYLTFCEGLVEDEDVLFGIDRPSFSSTTPPPKEPQLAGPGVKLQWKSSPAITGYIISELIRAGYLEPPTTNGELSYAKLAGICNQIFDIRSDGKQTTLDYLKKVVNPESNQLPNHKRAKINLPDLDQLT